MRLSFALLTLIAAEISWEEFKNLYGKEYNDRSEGLARTRLFHPWGREPEGGWSGSGVPCRTLSDTVTC